MSSARNVRTAFLLSLLLHLVGLFVIGPLWVEEQEVRAFRARLIYRPRFEPPPRLPVASITLPAVDMEYLEPQRTAPSTAEGEPGLPTPTPQAVVVPLPEVSSPQVVPEFKPATPQLALEIRPSPTAIGRVDTIESETMDLLRVEDMAGAGMSREEAEKAAIIPDVHSRRDLSGFVTFATLRLDGVSNIGRLHGLARFMRDHTRILAQVRHRSAPYFLSEQLLLYPIHFMYPGDRLAGSVTERFTYFSKEELELLGRYLRGGGFLYAEGRSAPPSVRGEMVQWWLNEMIVHVQGSLSTDGRYFQLPPTHPIYDAFYDLSPREQTGSYLDVTVPAWFFRNGVMDRPGLWGVELDGKLVAVFNKVPLDIRPDSDAPTEDDSGSDADEQTGDASAYGLRMMTNIVVYALTREGGLTRRRAQPAWKQQRPEIQIQTKDADSYAAEDDEIYDELGASLALVHAPLGSTIRELGMHLRFDGSFSMELLRSPGHALLLHNLPAGRHWIELRYGGSSHQLELDLVGGQVFTVSFSLNRFLFYEQLRLRPQGELIPVEDWLARFSDLRLEEVFFEEEEWRGTRLE